MPLLRESYAVVLEAVIAAVTACLYVIIPRWV